MQNYLEIEKEFNVTNNGFWIWNLSNNKLYFSAGYFSMLGYEPGEFKASRKNWIRLLHPDDKENAVNTLNKWLEHKSGQYNNIFRMKSKSGEWIWIKTTGDIVKETIEGENDLFIGNHINIQKYVDLNKKLLKTTNFYESILDNVQDGIWVADKDDIIYYANSSMSKITGVSNSEVIGKKIIEDFSENTIKEFKEYYLEAKNEKKPIWYRARVETPSDHMMYQNGWLIPILQDGEISDIICTVRDVTKRTEAELAKDKLSFILNKAETIGHVGAWEYNVITKEFWASDEAKRIYGVDPEIDIFTVEYAGNCIPDREKVNQVFINLIEKDEPYDLMYEIIQKNTNKSRYIHSVAELIKDDNNKPLKVSGFIQDITEQIIAQKALKESEEKYRSLLDNAEIGIGYFNILGDVLLFNKQAALNMGNDNPESFIGKNMKELFPDDYEKYFKRINIAAKSEKSNVYQDHVIINDKNYWFKSVYTRIIDDDGKLLGIQILSTDISELMNTTLKLKDKRDKLKNLFDHMNSGFAYHKIIIDDKGKAIDYKFLDCNKAFENLTGHKKELIIGKNVTSVIPEIVKDDFDWIGQYGSVALTGKSISFESYSKSLDRWCSVNAYSPQKGFFASVFDDITALKHYQEELITHRKNLEVLIKERTQELENKNKELEHFNQLFIGREFRIKELKNKIEKLQEEIDSLKK